MYAKELMIWLHKRLGEPGAIEQTQERFEKLRGYDLLPKGRENASIRLSDQQIANAVLGFAHPLPAVAGHASLILGDLRPVGGIQASYKAQPTLNHVLRFLVREGDASSSVQRVTFSVEQDFNGDEYSAIIQLKENDQRRSISFVSRCATSLLNLGAEDKYEHNRLEKPSAVERSFGSRFFCDLARDVLISRQLDRPLQTNWLEYESEEEKREFNQRLGSRPSSNFMNLRVETQVTWPKEPTRVKFGGHHLVLFPKTKDNSHSLSIDLMNERLSGDNARSLMNRMLSIMSWCEDRPASLHEGWSGGPIPSPVPKQNLAFITSNAWHFQRTLPSNEHLKKCLAFYRDGVNAYSVGLASHAVLSFFRVIETNFGKSKHAIIGWIDDIMQKFEHSIAESFPDYENDREISGFTHGNYIYKRCRVATAHAAEDAPSDPDIADETRRLLNAASVIRILARQFIKQEHHFSDSYFTDDSS